MAASDPAVTTEPLNPLSPRALRLRRLRILIEAGLVILVLGAGLVLVPRFTSIPRWAWWLPAVVVLATVIAWWWTGVEFSRWAWRLTADLFEVRRGVLIQRTHLVPRSRIQNVTTTAGPLQRRFGLLSLTVHTAGARTKNVTVDDLEAAEADAIRQRLGLT